MAKLKIYFKFPGKWQTIIDVTRSDVRKKVVSICRSCAKGAERTGRDGYSFS